MSAGQAVPYVDLVAQHAPLKAEVLAAVERVLDSGRFILGDEVEQFEREFAALCGAEYAVGVNSGTDALVLALRALGIGPGDEVITVPNSFVASAGCIVLAGAQPVFVDVRGDLNIDPDLIEAAITPRTKAILVVHLTGRPAQMDRVMDVSRRYGLRVVEDAAQAVGAHFDNRTVGSFGDVGCFSLHPLKTLNACGDGGVVTTSDRDVYERLTRLRNIGLRTRDDASEWSGNSRLDTMQAAILLVKLRHLHEWTARRRDNARFYQQALNDVVRVPVDEPRECAVYHTFVVQTPGRDALKEHLAQAGIGSAVHYPIPIHLTTIGRSLGYREGAFPMTERLAREILSLPVHQDLTRPQLEQVVEAVTDFFRGGALVP
jgi:dTDP-4-amino-4,6-dideoxygalactose transaminase